MPLSSLPVKALEAHPHAKAVLGPVVSGQVSASHAYLFHGPAGSGRSEAAAELATALLSRGAMREDTQTRVAARTHPDLTWIVPEGANGEVLVDDIRERVVGEVPLRPFEATCRVFVVEAADRMNDSAANAFLKTLEEPPAHAHIILIATSQASVAPTIASRCQRVRFEQPSIEVLAERLEGKGLAPERAAECARLADGNSSRAALLAGGQGEALRAAGQDLARAALSGSQATARPWLEIVAAAGEVGKAAEDEVKAAGALRLEVAAKSERSRLEREADERARRAKRRAESEAADVSLHVAEVWLRDVHRLALGVTGQAASPRSGELASDATGVDPAALRRAIELIERTRGTLRLNVGRELAVESLAHRLKGVLG